jgi:hypothetical protein
LEKEEKKWTEEELIQVGAINILALGYRGIEMWREKREPLTIKMDSDEEKA